MKPIVFSLVRSSLPSTDTCENPAPPSVMITCYRKNLFGDDESVLSSEFDAYMASEVPAPDFFLLEYWSGMKRQFPELAKLALLLAVLVTSTPSKDYSAWPVLLRMISTAASNPKRRTI